MWPTHGLGPLCSVVDGTVSARVVDESLTINLLSFTAERSI